MSRLLASLDAPPSGRARPVWFDAVSYGRAKLLDEGRVPAGELIHPQAYQPVLNVAGHYEWPVLIQTDAAAAWPHGPVPGVAAWLGSDPPAGPDKPAGRWGILAGPDFWDGVTPPAEADLVLTPVPADADPEAVMRQVRALA